MQCAFCKETIDDDSFYCDMCGEEIKTCPGCKKPGKGKRCTSCGAPLTTLKSQAGSSVAGGTNTCAQTPPPVGGKAPEPIASKSDSQKLPSNETIKSTIPQLRLINKNINADLKIDDNSIIGRETGQHVATFGCFGDVSGKHCRFNYDPAKGWCVTDLGSSYKTKYNNRELPPNTPQAISDQTYLKIARIEFFVRVIP